MVQRFQLIALAALFLMFAPPATAFDNRFMGALLIKRDPFWTYSYGSSSPCITTWGWSPTGEFTDATWPHGSIPKNAPACPAGSAWTGKYYITWIAWCGSAWTNTFYAMRQCE